MLNKETRRKNKQLRELRRAALFYSNTTKCLIWFFSLNGALWIWCSYLLAFMDKVQIAESLSANVCTIVIGQMAIFLITQTVQHVFKYNESLGGKSLPTNNVWYDTTKEIHNNINTSADNTIPNCDSTPPVVEVQQVDCTVEGEMNESKSFN